MRQRAAWQPWGAVGRTGSSPSSAIVQQGGPVALTSLGLKGRRGPELPFQISKRSQWDISIKSILVKGLPSAFVKGDFLGLAGLLGPAGVVLN